MLAMKKFFNYLSTDDKGRHDTQHNDIQHNDIQHNDIQHNDIQHNDAQNKGPICDTQHKWQTA